MLENKKSNRQLFAGNTDNQYLCFSSKFKKYFDDTFSENHSTAHLAFLSGNAGTGKSCTLQNEFTAPLSKRGIQYFLFNFIPDKNLHNHFFLDDIIEKIIGYVKREDGNKEQYPQLLDNLQNLQKRLSGSNGHPFDYSETHKEFIRIISEMSQIQKIVFIFEDIHLARKSFIDFLDQIVHSRHKLNINIICTTRKKKSDYAQISHRHQRWFYLDNLSRNNFYKYLQLLKSSYNISISSEKDLLGLSDGNPFYIKELYFLNKEQEGNVQFKKTFDHGVDFQENDGKSSIISIRFSYLNSKQRQILKTLAILGFNVHVSELQKILKEPDAIENDLILLQKNGYIERQGEFIRFQHHLMYEGIKKSIAVSESHALHTQAFRFFIRQDNKNLERLVYHAREAGLIAYACVLAKKLADRMYHESQYDLASDYYDLYVEWLKFSSTSAKFLNRTIDALIPLHAACLILGKKERAEAISSYLANISEETSLEDRFKIYSTLSTAYWTVGELTKARECARKNIENSKILNLRDAKLSTISRYGAISMEVGDFHAAVDMHKQVLDDIGPDEHFQKFSMFVEAYASSTSIESFCYAELGQIDLAEESALEGYKHFNETSDLFTQLYISVHCGYSMAVIGKFEQALRYLEQGIKTRETMKITLLVPPALALIGLCHFHLGNTEQGIKKTAEAQELARKTFQGSKKGIIDICYAESLLINFDTETFANKIDLLIDEMKDMQQFSYIAWLYFYKAVYHAFYNRSIQGFVGSYAKSSAIAQNLDMGTLTANLKSLANLEESRLLNMKNQEPVPNGFFDKSLFFYNKTRNVKPISFHIDSGTRS